MVKFECPHCGGKEFSAWDSAEHEKMECNACGKAYRNPYYRPYFGGASREKHLHGCF